MENELIISILLVITFTVPIGIIGINIGTLLYVCKYDKKLIKELDRINYKLIDNYGEKTTYLIEKIFPNFKEKIDSPFSGISVLINVLKKYRPFNIKKTLTLFNQKGLIAPMTNEEIKEREEAKVQKIQEEDKKIKQIQEIDKDLDRIYSQEKIKIGAKKISKEEIKEQLKLIKELDNSEVSLVLKIQALLVKLKKVNSEDYKTLNLEYEQLAKEGKLNGVILKDFLARLLCNLEYEVRNANIVINYLDSLIAAYENDNKEKTQLSFQELEELTQNIINNSNVYSKEDKLIIYSKLSLLYLYLIYENKDSITKERLEKSYFNHGVFLYSTILNINSLRKNNLIEDNLLFDISENYNLDGVLNLIKKIKFIKKDESFESKVLVK